MRPTIALPAVLAVSWLHLSASNAADLPRQVDQALVISFGGRGGQREFPVDPVAARVAAGEWKTPREGEYFPEKESERRQWKKSTADTNGWFTGSGLRGGYLSFTFRAEQDEPALLEAAGHEMVYVNGAPRVGDVYSSGIVVLPVQLRKGDNEFLFQTGRGRLKASLVPAPSRAVFNPRDMTLPDFAPENRGNTLGAVIVLNASGKPLSGVELRVTGPGGRFGGLDVPSIPAWGMRKIGFPIPAPYPLPPPGNIPLELSLVDKSTGAVLDTTKTSLRVLDARQSFKVTFRSAIDGSVQYYAVNPMVPSAGRESSPALFLSLHGAGVEALGQAQAYSPKSWGYLAAATNRRPYGYDWEDWGRVDAIEVLNLAMNRFNTDPSRTYLTGHSMGGHGTWQVGVTLPDRFAAIAPSAGWISFTSYAGRRASRATNGVEGIMTRAASPQDTLMLRSNLLHYAVYILHGGADDNVPVTEARKMRDELSKFHRDFTYFEQPGAGHWWDASDEPGADCVDWAPFFDCFARHRIPGDSQIRNISFSTANPGISSRSHWISIDLQEKSLEKSSITIRFDPGKRRFVGGTENAARIRIDMADLAREGLFSFDIDGTKITDAPIPNNRYFWLEKSGGHWSLADPPSLKSKGAHRCGPFKEAFGHEMVFVYGTAGTPEENRCAMEKARYDAEYFWYRGNASIDVIPDVEWDARRFKDRSVILYGNADGNRAWSELLASSPIQVRRGKITAGGKEFTGGGLGALFVQPRPDSNIASVGVVSGTGPAGIRLCTRLPYLLAGAAYPDWTILGADSLTAGLNGVLGAGFFGPEWSIETGDSAWK